jgi:predicted nucleic acid-binding protein
MLGYLRLTTNDKVMAGMPLTVTEAWNAYAALYSAPEVFLATEPANCDSAFQQIALAGSMASRLWTNAYLAAFAITAGMRAVTFEDDFARFNGLNLLKL